MSGTTVPATPIPPPLPQRQMVWAYAGFWWRVLAAIVDFAILSVVNTLLQAIPGFPRPGITTDGTAPLGDDGPVSHVDYTTIIAGTPHWHVHGFWALLISVLLTICYNVLLESSRWQATLGKRVCGMRVTDLSGRRIGLGRALGRHFGKYVSWMLLGIGFLMVGWTRRKQGLHDMMAGTLVMRRREADPVFTFNEPGT